MSRWQSAAEYAEELDHKLEELAAETRRAPAAKTDVELLQARWNATGLERARELLREVLNAAPDAPAVEPAERCAEQSLTGLRCTLRRGHSDLHQAPGVEWLSLPRKLSAVADPVCSRCLRRQSRHGAGGRDAECPDGFVARGDE